MNLGSLYLAPGSPQIVIDRLKVTRLIVVAADIGNAIL